MKTASNEIYIRSKILTFGTYELKLIVTVMSSSILTSFESMYIKIVQSKRPIVNLIEFGTSEIALGQDQGLLLEPGKYSVDEDGNKLIEDVCIRKMFHLFLFNRNGILNIIVEFMILRIF
jgi:hypothetical protein